MKLVCVKCLNFINFDYMIHLVNNDEYYHSKCYNQIENENIKIILNKQKLTDAQIFKKIYNEKHPNYIKNIINFYESIYFKLNVNIF